MLPLQGRERPGQEDAEKGEADGRQKDAAVGGKGRIARGQENGEGIQGPGGDQDASHSAHGAENQAFHQELANQTAPAGAKGCPKGHLPGSRFSLSQEEVGQITASNEEDQKGTHLEDEDGRFEVRIHQI